MNVGRKNRGADDSMMFYFAGCSYNCLCQQGRFAIAGSYKFVTELSTKTSCTLYSKLTAFYTNMELLTSDCMLLSIKSASSFRYFL